LSAASKKQAAILALHFSKRREDRSGEVYCTTRQQLRKKPSFAPGSWEVLKADTLYIRYSEEELKSVLTALCTDGLL
jgi:hypothetical protein